MVQRYTEMAGQAARLAVPSSGPSDHLLPQGEKGSGGNSRLGAHRFASEGNAALVRRLHGSAKPLTKRIQLMDYKDPATGERRTKWEIKR
ncbi:MAG: hypothetical protein KKH72_07105 [Alphaproteobacteria bacterium]|nr:hypothetical protein [Alphaproteobacteria bacterium]